MKKAKRYYKRFLLLLLCVSILFTSNINVSAVAAAPIAAEGLREIIFNSFMINSKKQPEIRAWSADFVDSFWEAAEVDDRLESIFWKIHHGTYITGEVLDLTLEEIKNGTAFVQEQAETLEYTITPYQYYAWSFLDSEGYLASNYIFRPDVMKLPGSISPMVISTFANYLDKSIEQIMNEYYVVGDGVYVLVPYGKIYINNFTYETNVKFRNKLADPRQLENYLYEKNIHGYQYARTNLENSLNGVEGFVYYNGNVLPLDTYSGGITISSIYAYYDKWVSSNSMALTITDKYSDIKAFDKLNFYTYNLSKKVFKDKDYGIAINKGISIPLTEEVVDAVDDPYSPIAIAKAVYETGVYDKFVYELNEMFDSQTATQKTFFGSVVDAIGVAGTKVVDSIGSAVDALLEKIGEIALTAKVAKKLADEAIQGALTHIKDGVIALPDKIADAFVLSLPGVIATSIALALEGDLPSEPGGEEEEEPTRSRNFFENLLYLFIYIAMILIKLLQIFIQLYIFIFSIFNIPASTVLLPSDFILGLEFMRNFPLPLFNLTLYQFLTGVLNIILLFSVIGLLRRYIFRMKIPEAK